MKLLMILIILCVIEFGFAAVIVSGSLNSPILYKFVSPYLWFGILLTLIFFSLFSLMIERLRILLSQHKTWCLNSIPMMLHALSVVVHTMSFIFVGSYWLYIYINTAVVLYAVACILYRHAKNVFWTSV